MSRNFILGFCIFVSLVGCNSSKEDQTNTEAKVSVSEMSSLNPLLSSQATMVYNRYLKDNPDGGHDFSIDHAPKLKDHYSIEEGELCSEVKGKDLPITANCSGILVGADLMLTAGQCYLGQQRTCDDFKWVFDYSPSQKHFKSHQVYNCKKIIHYSVSVDLNETNDQWALIQLDRKVENRLPLELAKTSDEEKGRVLGNFFGLSPQISKVKEIINSEGFKTGNFDQEFPVPGSSIINSDNQVLGVVIRTEGGFVKNEERGCYLPKECDDKSCFQTTIGPIEYLPFKAKEVILKNKAYNAIENNDKKKLKELIYLGVNLKTKDLYGKTLALRALELNHTDIFKTLFEYGVDLDATDTIGQGLFHYIVRGNAIKTFDFFTNWKFDINKEDSLGRTALFLAKKLGHLNMVKKLQELGGEIGSPRVHESFLDFCNDPYASEETKLAINLLKQRVQKESCEQTYLSLSNLENIYLSHPLLKDLRPLSDLIKLKRLDIKSSSLEDISFLKDLKNLEKLHIEAQEIKGLDVLVSLPNLNSLTITGSADYTVLSQLKGIKTLKLKKETILDTSFLSSMTELEVLYLEGNVEDFIVPNLTKLKELKVQIGKEFDLSILKPLTGLKKLTAQYNDITDISALSSLSSLERLYLTQNKITDLSPLSSLKKLKTLVVSRNPIKKGEEFCPTKNVSRALSRFCKRNNR